MVDAECRRGIVVDAARPRLPVDHAVVVPGYHGHDKAANHEADDSAERAGLGQKRSPRPDKGVPPHGTAKGQRPGGN